MCSNKMVSDYCNKKDLKIRFVIAENKEGDQELIAFGVTKLTPMEKTKILKQIGILLLESNKTNFKNNNNG